MLPLPNFSEVSSPVRSGLLGSHGLPPTIPLLPDWSGLSNVTQDGQLANPLPGIRMVWLPDDFAAWPSGTDGSVAPGDLIQSQFGPAATITVTIAAEAELASLAPPTLPARPHARRTHFSRHDYQPFFANTPRNLSRLSDVTARTHVPRNDFSIRHQCPFGDVSVALSASHIAEQSSSLSCLPGPKRKNPQKRMTLCGFLIRVHLSR